MAGLGGALVSSFTPVRWNHSAVDSRPMKERTAEEK
jgi:hypothetical protein